MSTSRTIVKNIAALSLAEIATRLIATGLSVVIARYLGVDVYGQLGFATAVFAYLNLFTDFGLSTYAIKEISQDRARAKTLVPSILAVQLSISGLLILLVAGIGPLVPLPDDTKWLTFLYALTIIPTALNIAYVYTAWERMEVLAISRVATQVVALVLSIILLVLWQNVVALPIAQLIASTICALVLFVILKRQVTFDWLHASMSVAVKVLSQSWPFLISAIAVQIYMNSDMIFLQFMRDQTEVGYYNAAYRIILIVVTAGSFMSTAIFPMLTSAAINDRPKFYKALSLSSKASGLITLPVTVGGLLVASSLIPFIFGNEYQQAIKPFSILLLLLPIMFLNAPLSTAMVAEGKQKIIMKAAISGALLNLVANVILIPSMGMVGAAISSILAEIIILIFYITYNVKAADRQLLTTVFGNFIKGTALPILVMVASILIAQYYSLHLIAQICLAGLVYGTALILFKSLATEEISQIRKAIHL